MLKTSEKEWWAVIYENSNEQFSGERKKMKYSKIFFELQNKRVENFDFDGNYEPKILLHLKDIELKCLKTLNISKNNIDSISVLCRINIPALEELYLYQNSIITLNTLRKSLIPALKYLALYDNPIHSFKPVLEMNSLHRQSMRVNFEIYYGNVNGCAGNWIFKLNTVSTQNMKMGSQKIFAKNIGTPAASELLNLFADFL